MIFLNIQFLIFNKASIQIKMRNIAIITFEPEFTRGSSSPKPENDNGPIKRTIKPPPIMIKTHIAKMNENIGRDIRNSLPS